MASKHASKFVCQFARAATPSATFSAKPFSSNSSATVRRSLRPLLAPRQRLQRRYTHTVPLFNSVPDSVNAADPPQASAAPDPPSQRPHYELTFTCVPCGSRSRHNVSKQGYHHGSVLITCPSCRNRHVISDHLGIFSERKGYTVEDLLRERGRLVKRGTLGEDGDVEFWEDGSVTPRDASVPMTRSSAVGAAAANEDAAPGASFATPATNKTREEEGLEKLIDPSKYEGGDEGIKIANYVFRQRPEKDQAEADARDIRSHPRRRKERGLSSSEVGPGEVGEV